MTSLLLVLNDFIQNLFTTKSSKCKSAFLCKWASRPHIETGIHSHINTSASEVTAVWCYINQFIIIIIIIIIIITCSSRGRQTVNYKQEKAVMRHNANVNKSTETVQTLRTEICLYEFHAKFLHYNAGYTEIKFHTNAV